MPYEISGFNAGPEIVGDDLEDILGAMDDDEYELSGRAQKKLRIRRPNRLANLPLPIDATVVAAGESATIRLRPQQIFKPYRISTTSTNFSITDVRVGNSSQFVSAGGIPSECFAPNATMVALKGETAVPGMEIIVIVENLDAANPQTFRGMIIGDVAHSG